MAQRIGFVGVGGLYRSMNTIVFDFDGTLADTLPICYYAFQQVFSTYDQRELTPDQIRAMFGPSEVGMLQKNLVNQPYIENAISDFYRHYEDRHGEYVTQNESIHRMLTELKNAGHRIAIFTGKGRRSLDISLRQLQLQHFFDIAITGDDVTSPKPNPEGLYLIMNALGARSEEVVLLGDSDADIKAGKAANVLSIRVDWFNSSSPELRNTKLNTQSESQTDSQSGLQSKTQSDLQIETRPDSIFYTIDECRRFFSLQI